MLLLFQSAKLQFFLEFINMIDEKLVGLDKNSYLCGKNITEL